MISTVFIIQLNPEIDDYILQHGNISAIIRFFGQKSKVNVRLLLITPNSACRPQQASQMHFYR